MIQVRDEGSWICCQIGARQHYGVPRALHSTGRLAALITDIWAPPDGVVGRIGSRRIRDRYHAELADAPVIAFNRAAIGFEATQALRRCDPWDVMMRRNEWFQDRAIRELDRLSTRHSRAHPYLFSFSYAARRLFQFAKSKRWATVLEQIDPGPREEELVRAVHEQNPTLAGHWQPAPREYWRHLKEEWSLSDRIIVNSLWSLHALIDSGVPKEKIRVVPLAYEPSPAAASFRRTYPARFTRERPLRVLFLGLVNLRKGMAQVLEAMALLNREPVEFWFVGPVQFALPAQWRSAGNARWIGSVPRSATEVYYKNADVFLFPTLSDGFGLTQLEAQAWKLPVIASRHCGDVVRRGVNGVILDEVSGQAIADAIRDCVINAPRLLSMSRNARVSSFSLDHVEHELKMIHRSPVGETAAHSSVR